MTDDGGVTQVDAQQTLLAGEKARDGHGRAAGPPIRPPPPRINGSQTSSPVPARGVVAAPAKGAFDDLDDSIRQAFGGSPSKSFPLQGGAAMGSNQPVAGFIGSSSQQHAFAPNTQMFPSPGKGAAANGGGSR